MSDIHKQESKGPSRFSPRFMLEAGRRRRLGAPFSRALGWSFPLGGQVGSAAGGGGACLAPGFLRGRGRSRGSGLAGRIAGINHPGQQARGAPTWRPSSPPPFPPPSAPTAPLGLPSQLD